MILCKVIGKCVSTIKSEGLSGIGLVMVQRAGGQGGEVFVAADTLGCPQNAVVLVASGSAARIAARCREAPIDHAVVAIVDDGSSLTE